MKHYYVVHFNQQNAFDTEELNFEKRVKEVGIRDGSYILYDNYKSVVSIVPMDSVLYILKIEEEE